VDGGAFLQVLTTAASEEEAEAIASTLLESRLAGCVQIVGPVRSRFWWEGRIDEAREWLCLAKTTADRYQAVEAAIRQSHSYDVPEVVAMPVVRGSDDYLAWLGGVVGETS
jgi:periplasmic divalent cation tolerance protein